MRTTVFTGLALATSVILTSLVAPTAAADSYSSRYTSSEDDDWDCAPTTYDPGVSSYNDKTPLSQGKTPYHGVVYFEDVFSPLRDVGYTFASRVHVNYADDNEVCNRIILPQLPDFDDAQDTLDLQTRRQLDDIVNKINVNAVIQDGLNDEFSFPGGDHDDVFVDAIQVAGTRLQELDPHFEKVNSNRNDPERRSVMEREWVVEKAEKEGISASVVDGYIDATYRLALAQQTAGDAFYGEKYRISDAIEDDMGEDADFIGKSRSTAPLSGYKNPYTSTKDDDSVLKEAEDTLEKIKDPSKKTSSDRTRESAQRESWSRKSSSSSSSSSSSTSSSSSSTRTSDSSSIVKRVTL